MILSSVLVQFKSDHGMESDHDHEQYARVHGLVDFWDATGRCAQMWSPHWGQDSPRSSWHTVRC
jgi:hypothetical protein